METTIDDPNAFLDPSGKTLRRRINWTLGFEVFVALLMIAAVVLLSFDINGINEVQVEVASAKAQFATLQGLIQGSPIAASSVSTAALFACPAGSVVPDKWVILGSQYAHGQDATTPWYSQMLQLAGSSRQAVVPVGTTLQAQILALQSDATILSWVSAGSPLLVLYEFGYYESLAALANQLGEASDPRALPPTAISANDALLLQQSWWLGSQHMIVFLIPTLPFAPQLGGYVPPSIQMCTDSLAQTMFNVPDTLATMQAVSQLSNGVALSHSLSILSAQNSASPPASTINIVTTDFLFASFGFNTAATANDIAFGSDCLYLNEDGQSLLAHYVWSCLQGQDFSVPVSLMDV